MAQGATNNPSGKRPRRPSARPAEAPPASAPPPPQQQDAGQLDLEKMEELRRGKGWTQETAAAAADLGGGRQQWNNIVNGHQSGITLATLQKIAGALGVKVKDLLK